MKKGLLFSLLICVSFGAFAQQYPPEWVQYTTGGYLADIQSDRNSRNLPDSEFKNYLLNLARTNLAKQIRMHIEEVAEMKKSSIDGRTSIAYSSGTRFSTDIDLESVETKTSYDPQTGAYHAIAYIDKKTACRYYRNRIETLLSKTQNTLQIARNYIDTGFKSRAKTELESALSMYATADESFFRLAVFGFPQDKYEELLDRCHESEKNIKNILSELQYGTSVYLVCTADIFGAGYTTLQNELKGILSEDGCNFTDNPAHADWIIRINASSREFNNTIQNGVSFYFAYADADIAIDKTITSQRIYENTLSAKGAHTLNYTAAARTAYKNLSKQLGLAIKQTVKQ